MTTPNPRPAPTELWWSPTLAATTGWGLCWRRHDAVYVRPHDLPDDAVRLVPALPGDRTLLDAAVTRVRGILGGLHIGDGICIDLAPDLAPDLARALVTVLDAVETGRLEDRWALDDIAELVGHHRDAHPADIVHAVRDHISRIEETP